MGCAPCKGVESCSSSSCSQRTTTLQFEQQGSPFDPTPHEGDGSNDSSIGQALSLGDSISNNVTTTSAKKSNKYICQKQIGSGHFGSVFVATTPTGAQVAIKKLHHQHHHQNPSTTEIERKDEAETLQQQEISALQKCFGHPCIVQLIEVVRKPFNTQHQHTCIITEYIEGSHWGSSPLTERQGSVPMTHKRLNHIRGILRDILLALHHLHDVVGIAHMDIKPENILVLNHTTTNQGKEDSDDLGPPGSYAKLIDLGSAIPLQVGDDGTTAMTSNTAGTFYFCSPEKLSSPYYCPKKADVWALGVTAAVAIFDDPNVPFPTAVTQSRSCFKRYLGLLAYRCNFSKEDFSLPSVHPDSLEFPSDAHQLLSSDLLDVLKRMTRFDSQSRPTVFELLQHRWFVN